MDATTASRDTYVFDAFRVDRCNRQLVRLDSAGRPTLVPPGARAFDILITDQRARLRVGRSEPIFCRRVRLAYRGLVLPGRTEL